MQGWVYVIANKSMPDLIKVGFSLYDPDERARQLNSTGSPHPFYVEYESLVENPKEVEKKAHALLSEFKESGNINRRRASEDSSTSKGAGVEWFRCKSEEGITAIQAAAGDSLINEAFKAKDKENLKIAAQLLAEEKNYALNLLGEEREAAKLKSIKTEDIKKIISIEEKELLIKFNKDIAEAKKTYFFEIFCAVFVTVFFIFYNISSEPISFNQKTFFITLVISLVLAKFIVYTFNNKEYNSKICHTIKKEYEENLEVIKIFKFSCNSCSTKIIINRIEIMADGEYHLWKCPKCKEAISIPLEWQQPVIAPIIQETYLSPTKV